MNILLLNKLTATQPRGIGFLEEKKLSQSQSTASWWAPPRDGRSRRALVEVVNREQNTSYAHRDSWYSFCDERCGGTRDPNCHGADALGELLLSTANHPPLSQEGLVALDTLVDMVKQTARASRQGLMIWRSFCDSNTAGAHSYSPALLHPDLLVSSLETECPQGKERHPTQPPLERKPGSHDEWTAVVCKKRYRGRFGR